jgi:CBS domain-containing protein
MNVEAILKEKGGEVISTAPNVSLGEIVRLLNASNIGSVVLVNEEGNVAGIISERDIVRALGDKGAAALTAPASEYMSRKVIACCRADTLEKLMAEMTRLRHRHLPVVENGRLAGLISIGDLVKQRLLEAEMEAAAMRDYIKTG